MSILATPTTSTLWSAAYREGVIPPGSLAARLSRACGGPHAALNTLANALARIERPPAQISLPGVEGAQIDAQRSATVLMVPSSMASAERAVAVAVAGELGLRMSTGASWFMASDGWAALRLTHDRTH